MDAYHIDTRSELVDNAISISPSCHDIGGGDGAMHCVHLMYVYPGAFMVQAAPFARSRYGLQSMAAEVRGVTRGFDLANLHSTLPGFFADLVFLL